MAAVINYGDTNDFTGGGTVEYVNIAESSNITPLPLYGAPGVSVNTLDFDASTFGASANAGRTTNVNGVASFGIRPMAGYYINAVTLQESGDYTLLGAGTSNTFLQLSAPVTVTITEVDGAPIAPVVVSTALVLAPKASGHYNLDDDFGIGTWQGDLVVDIDFELMQAGVSYTFGATDVDVTLDNSMVLETEAASSTLVRMADTSAMATVSLPEPSTVTLALLGLGGLLLRRRR